MTSRNILSYRKVAGLTLTPEGLAGQRLVLASRFEPEPGRVLLGGTDVTEEALGWASLSSLVKRGVIRIEPASKPPVDPTPTKRPTAT